jgi:AMP-polyphosphate phosphotransferase
LAGAASLDVARSSVVAQQSMLEELDLEKSLSKAAAAVRIKALQSRLRLLQYSIQEADVPVIVCLEGWNACGRGEVIKKLSELLDPRLYQVNRGRPPSPLELRYHFLWRYQLALPGKGQMVIFDHSWYARVLEDRCDHLVAKNLWRQAYSHINEFERWLVDDGAVLVKFWLHISKREQRRRYRAYRKDPLLRWKVTKDYWRQHKHYGRWLKAADEMLTRSSTAFAPWTLIEAEDLQWARVRALETLVDRMEAALKFPLPAWNARHAASAESTSLHPVSRRRGARAKTALTEPAEAARDV